MCNCENLRTRYILVRIHYLTKEKRVNLIRTSFDVIFWDLVEFEDQTYENLEEICNKETTWGRNHEM